VVLFVIIFLWKATTHQMVLYTAALVVSSLLMLPVADLGWIYGVTATAAGALFLWGSIDLGRRPSLQRSMRLFAFSISYITLLFGALTLDVLVRHGV
jgi:protoheme IX farnesyltransferase